MKIALVQLNPIVGDFPHNAEQIVSYADKARAAGADLVVFSELVIPGYPPRDLLEKNDFVRSNLDCVNSLKNTIQGIGVLCGYVAINPENEGKSLYNAAVLFENGQVLQHVYKRLLPTYDVFDESRYFEPGTVSEPIFYKGLQLGVTICEDAWNDKDIFSRRIYHLDPVAHLVEAGAELIVNISASPFHVGKHDFRRHMLGAIAKKYRVPLAYVNQVGGNDSLLFDGLSTVFDRDGRIAGSASDFQEDMIVYDTETDLSERHPGAGSDIESLLAALVMGTRDYVSKCGFSKVVIGLSGGIDSALTACIAARALGPENVSTIFMPSRYTSQDNYEDTQLLAENLAVSYRVVPIDTIYGSFLESLPFSTEREPGITEQNLQARIRGTTLMAVSNKEGSILLSTGNKSELAVGYCTLYGDMAGGLAVISDVPKTMVYELSRYINRQNEVIPQRILDKPPSAELKPDQTDQDDLPSYDVLDPLLAGYIEDLKGESELIREGHPTGLVGDVVSRVVQNEYKRHQAAPGLKVTSKAFGYGRRYPMAQRYRPKI
ncbi:NAD synthetase (EC / Glutamine amidotransferase chain of NAD synthetase [Olavius algarvensis associated proteobacterium Delta 3]|nr:NAD synthetase (EC / Glutamine amidotransferase chain of NAD synthetase [Olavius algarvensis associated proteobacterium Delta 3]CAB5135195.1 NAD synthetase (EC / Glutamine amidotransferase chain of NAD synthetase [Olavius algarvensis associated proteobacterium Delta 3]